MADLFDRIFGITADPRVDKLFLVQSPLQLIGILVLYILFVKKWGPSLMKSRQPFDLKGALVVYNSLQVVINVYLFYQGFLLLTSINVWEGKCYMTVPNQPEIVARLIFLSHMYCMTKVLDLLDTVFFVLRKRYNQVSFLHFYHHILMCGSCFLVLRYIPTAPLSVIGLINAGVHAVMYTYYLISSFSPNKENQLWWKKYITLLQIAQFIFVIGYVTYPVMHGEYCGVPKKLTPFIITQDIIMLILFINFYIKSYIMPRKAKAA